MACECFFSKLRDTVAVINKVPDLESRAEKALNRDDRSERNILQCPEGSLQCVAEMRQSVKDQTSELVKIHSNLRMIGIENSKLLANAEAILAYTESETEKMEMHLKEKHDFVPLSERENNMSMSKRLSSLGGKELPKINLVTCKTNSKSMKNNVEFVPSVPETIPEEQKKNSLLVMPRSPDIKEFIPSYKEKDIGRISMPSPESPSNKCVSGRGIMGLDFGAKTEPLQTISNGPVDNHKPTLGGMLDHMASPQTPTLETAFFGRKQNRNDQHETSDSLSTSMKFFKTPRVKEPKEMNHENEINDKIQCTEVESPGPGFTLHSRRSVLANVPEAKESIDDDTVLLLGGRRMRGADMVTPESPELTQVRTLPKIQPRELNNYFHRPELDGGCPMTPPSPQLKFQINDPEADEKENLGPETSPAYEVTEKQYQLLPEYLKRLMPLAVTNECLEKVLETTFALPGEKYPKVTTETRIAEAVGLGSKTKSFTFLLISLKIIHKIVGTEYFEVFV